MMTAIFIMILFCSVVGPIGLCLGVKSNYSDIRLLFSSVAVLCGMMIGALFGTFFGTDILTEIVAHLYAMPMGSGN